MCWSSLFFWLCQCILASQQFLQESWGFLKLWTSLTHRKPQDVLEHSLDSKTETHFQFWKILNLTQKISFLQNWRNGRFYLLTNSLKALLGKCQSQLRPSETFTSLTSSKFPCWQQLLLNGMGQIQLLWPRTGLPYSFPVNPTDLRGN